MAQLRPGMAQHLRSPAPRRLLCTGPWKRTPNFFPAVCPVNPALQVTPRDYLEIALQPLQGSERAVESKNQASRIDGNLRAGRKRQLATNRRRAGHAPWQRWRAANAAPPCAPCPPGPHAPTGLTRNVCPQIRESIKSLFPDRDCFTLVRPVNDEDKLAQLDSLPPAEMRPEFRCAGEAVPKEATALPPHTRHMRRIGSISGLAALKPCTS